MSLVVVAVAVAVLLFLMTKLKLNGFIALLLVSLGVGLVMGIPVAKQRDRMDEALDVLVPLLRGEKVTAKTEWFELNDAQLQMNPYTRPSVHIAVANQVSPTGARAAGKHGLALG